MNQVLKDEIEFLREEMLNSAKGEGSYNSQTLQLSKKLDDLMNELMIKEESQDYSLE